MKIQLDTKEKTIKIEEAINISELVNGIKKLFPNNLWKEFKIETNTTIVWNNPYVIQPSGVYPWGEIPWITWDESGTKQIYS